MKSEGQEASESTGDEARARDGAIVQIESFQISGPGVRNWTDRLAGTQFCHIVDKDKILGSHLGVKIIDDLNVALLQGFEHFFMKDLMHVDLHESLSQPF